jgi:rod shape-determining protein MreB
MASLRDYFSLDIGIDLGTANTLVYVRGKGIVVNESSVVAIDNRTKAILAIGDEAKKMVGKTPAHITAIRPLRDGVVSHFEVTEEMLRYFIEKVSTSRLRRLLRPRVLVGIPYGVTEVERRAAEEAALAAGAGQVYLIEEPIAAAIGANLPIQEATGSMIVDIGGGTTEVAVISLGGVVTSRSLRIAGDEMNEDIINFARDHFNILLGERTAEEIKIKIGSAFPLSSPLRTIMRGRDLLTGLPKEIEITDEPIREALEKSISVIVETIKATVEEAPAELVADIMEQGVVLTGGGSLLRGLDKRIAEATNIKVYVSKEPLTAVVRGTGLVLEDLGNLRDVLLPSTLANVYK